MRRLRLSSSYLEQYYTAKTNGAQLSHISPHLPFSPLIDLALERVVGDQICAARCVS